jgi:hypothetical protein
MGNMDDDELDIDVALTTTKFALVTEDGDNQLEIDLILQDIPVCVAEMYMELDEETELNIKDVAKYLLRSMNDVKVYSDIKKVFIGENFRNEYTAIVLYYGVDAGKEAISFFERWDETQVMIFEYCLKRKNKDLLLSIRGLYKEGAWKSLSVYDKQIYKICENF